MSKYAIVLAGGLGIKFWPKSRENCPKQFIHLFGDGTFVQNTYKRLNKYFSKDNIFFVCPKEFKNLLIEQLPDVNDENIVIEPFGRNTAPATALALEYMQYKGIDIDSTVAVFPSDHIINNLGEFYESLDDAFEVAKKFNSIVTIGISPLRPETQYGYIQINAEEPIELFESRKVFNCLTFAEKPDIGTAIRFYESGDFLWNSGIFVWKISLFKKVFKEYLPEYYDKIKDLENLFGKSTYEHELRIIYKQLNSISLDYGILEKYNDVKCVKADFFWSDISNWDELHRLHLKDANNNVLEGNIVSIENKNCIVKSENKLIAMVGVNDLIVIEGKDAILICNKGESDRVQEVVEFLRRNFINNHL